MIDMIGETCDECLDGEYEETSIYDDWGGYIRCNKCGHYVKRWREDDS